MKPFFLVSLVALIAAFATACGGGSTGPVSAKGDVGKGRVVFASTCSACHGANAKGMPGLGKDLTASPFVKGTTDDQLLDFVKKGRPASDPANTTHVDMPPKGGNPALTDQNLSDVIAFLRSVNQ